MKHEKPKKGHFCEVSSSVIRKKKMQVCGNKNNVKAEGVRCIGNETICEANGCFLVGAKIQCYGNNCTIIGRGSSVYGKKCKIYDPDPIKISNPDTNQYDRDFPTAVYKLKSALEKIIKTEESKATLFAFLSPTASLQYTNNTTQTSSEQQHPRGSEEEIEDSYSSEETEYQGNHLHWSSSSLEQEEEEEEENNEQGDTMLAIAQRQSMEEEQLFEENLGIKEKRDTLVSRMKSRISDYKDKPTNSEELACPICSENVKGLVIGCECLASVCKKCLVSCLDKYKHTMPECPFCKQKYQNVNINPFACKLNLAQTHN